MQIYTIEQMRSLEQAADAAGYSYAAMMEGAGSAVAQATEQWIERQSREARRVLVLAGPCSNGGDGLIAARELAKRGYSTVAYLWKRDEQDPLVADAREHNVSFVRAENDNGDLLARALDRAEIIIDALFGTGLSRPIEGEPAAILGALRRRRTTPPEQDNFHWLGSPSAQTPRTIPALIAVDVPSGLHGDNGEVDEATVAADLTITFAGPKQGMFSPDAANVLGELVVADIGIPESILQDAESTAQFLTPQRAATLLPLRPRSGHKGTFGTVMVVGGSINYIGAPALSAIAAGRSGAGLVTLGVPGILQPMLAPRADLTTTTWLLLPHDIGALRADAVKLLTESLAKVKAIVLGPGIGTETVTKHFVWNLFGLEAPNEPRNTMGFAARTHDVELKAKPSVELPPTVIDADALNILASWEGEWWKNIASPLILTPHPAEMGRLLGKETQEVQADRLTVAQEAATRFNQIIILKGAFTVVAAPDGRISVVPYANDALAKAGSGDVLSGIAAALLGQGVEPYDAACLAVVAHGLAGEALRQEKGGRAALASDLLEMLPSVWQQLDALSP